MEGFKGIKHYILIIIYIIFCYIYSENSYDIKYLSILPILNSIPNLTLHTITGNMLGDGSISLSKIKKGEGKYSMTMDVYSLNYLNHLNDTIYSQITNKIFMFIQMFYFLNIKVKKLLNIILVQKHILYLQLYTVCDINGMMIKINS
jgi:hypothetical protein